MMETIENINEEVLLVREDDRLIVKLGGIAIKSWDYSEEVIEEAMNYGQSIAESFHRLDETGFVSEETEIAYSMYQKSYSQVH